MKLFESNAIAYFVSNEELRGGNQDANKAQVLNWLDYGASEIQSASASWVFTALSLVQFNQTNVNKAKEDVKRILTNLNDYLKTRTYLVGERITLADISVAADLLLLYQNVLDAQFREPFANVNRWFQTVVSQQNVKDVVGEVKLCEKAAEFNGKSLYLCINRRN